MALAAVGQRVARARRAAMRGARAAHQLTRYTGDPSRFADLGPLAAAGEPWALGLGPWALGRRSGTFGPEIAGLGPPYLTGKFVIPYLPRQRIFCKKSLQLLQIFDV
jgi:hypothetical protein